MSTRIAARAAVAALALTMTVAGMALADSVDGDADVVASGTQGLINLGTVAPGSTHTLDIGFTLVCKGTSHAAVGTTVTLTPTATPPTEGGTITASTASVGPVPLGWPAAGDACVGDPVVPSTNPSHVSLTAPTVGGSFTYRVSFTRSPNTGTSGTTLAQIALSVDANTPPELDLPGDLTKEADTTGGWTAAFTVGATDAEDASDPAVTCSVDQGDVLPLGHTTVDCSATDTGGLTAAASFDVDVVDTTSPDLGALPSPSASTTDPSGTAVGWTTPSATDIADPSPVVTCAPASGSVFPIGTTTVTCTAVDASGNERSGTFDVTVTLDTPPPPPNTEPQLDLPGNLTKEADTIGGWTAAFTVDATDVEDATAPDVTCSVSPGDVLPLGHTTVDCSATDTGGLTATGSFEVDVLDTTAPELGALPSPSASTADPSGTAVSWTDPTATDVADPSPDVSCAPASGSVFPVGTTTVTCTATDQSGNHASGSFDVAVTLDSPPDPNPDPNPDPGPGAALGVTWVSPLGDAPLIGRLGRSIPVKAGVVVDGAARLPADGPAPTLRADRLAGCTADAATIASLNLGPMRWSDGRWSLVVDTTPLAAGCWRLVVIVDGSDAGGAIVRLVADASVGGDKPPASLNGNKPHTYKDAFKHHRHRHRHGT